MNKCRFSAGKQVRQTPWINDIITRNLISEITATLEAVGLYRDDGKRINGVSPIT